MAPTGDPSTGRWAGRLSQFQDHLDYVASSVGRQIGDRGELGRWGSLEPPTSSLLYHLMILSTKRGEKGLLVLAVAENC